MDNIDVFWSKKSAVKQAKIVKIKIGIGLKGIPKGYMVWGLKV
jgi:hypothetical protein